MLFIFFFLTMQKAYATIQTNVRLMLEEKLHFAPEIASIETGQDSARLRSANDKQILQNTIAETFDISWLVSYEFTS